MAFSKAIDRANRLSLRGHARVALLLAASVLLPQFQPLPVLASSTADPAARLPAVRTERHNLACGAEITTILGDESTSNNLPLVSYLTDTLGDDEEANDVLRYVWIYSYCPPTFSQRLLASVPFMYRGLLGRRSYDSSKPPPIVFDFSKPTPSVWRRIAWYMTQAALLDPRGWVVKASTRTYARNEADYRRAHLRNGLAVLQMSRELGDDLGVLSDDKAFELAYGRVVEQGFAGAFLNERHLADVYDRDTAGARRRIGANWELLRQRCEDEGLYFDPVPEAPARAEHAIVWVRRDELERSESDRTFDGRFLNITNPWSDPRLRSWQGYTRIFYADADGRVVAHEAEGLRPVEMIPLALYGLDFPKIPALLVDFRSVFNPTKRELSRSVVEDVGHYLLNASPFGDLSLYLARRMYAFVTARKGIDFDQPTRAHSYAQLRSLMILRDSFEPELRQIIERDMARSNVNPLQNDAEAERHIAFAQYAALKDEITSGALDDRVERDRAAERTRIAHGRFGTAMLKVATVASFGLYRHRDDDPEDLERYAVHRALRRHGDLLTEVATAPAPIDISWSPERYREALRFVAAHGRDAQPDVAEAVFAIFRKVESDEIRLLAVDALKAFDSSVARRMLAEISADATIAADVRARCGPPGRVSAARAKGLR